MVRFVGLIKRNAWMLKISRFISQSSNLNILKDMNIQLIWNHGNNILKLFDIWQNFPFTTSETKCDY